MCFILRCLGDEWVHENPEVEVQYGDTVYYWTYVLFEGLGYQLLNQEWLASKQDW